MKKLLLLILTLCLIMGCAKANKSTEEITIEDKIGQLLIFGFVGTEPSQMAIDAIEKQRAGGVIFFDVNVSDKLPEGGYGPRNIESPQQVKSLVDSLQRIAQDAGLPKLFVSIDQEGGRVNRLKERYGFPATISAEDIGEKNDAAFTESESQKTAKTLKSLGISINFAPCADLAVNLDNPIIAGVQRAFSDKSEEVIIHNKAWIKGHKSEGILTSLKHFPGHGSSKEDSHLGLTDVTQTWSREELRPYEEIIGGGYDEIVMIGHLFNSNIDSQYPSSLSKATLDILRKDIGFQGVVVTDDMNMGAIIEEYSLEQALELALNAGVDVIVIGNNAGVFESDLVERTHALILKMVSDGRVSEDRIEEAYGRVMRLKERL